MEIGGQQSSIQHLGSMDPIDFETLDTTEYTRTPNIPLRSTVALGRALLRRRPSAAGNAVDKAAAKLEATLQDLEAALTDRLRCANREAEVRDVDFDRAIDALWTGLRDRLTAWFGFHQHGLAALTSDMQEQADIPRSKQQAARAQALHDRLFGCDGVGFTQQPFIEQSAAMAALLRLIDEDGHVPDLVELAGPEWLKALRVCQVRYEGMIDDRLARERSMTRNLAKARNRLRRMITAYNTAVLTLLDDDVPETLDLVLAALRPMVQIRRSLNRRNGQSEDIEDILDDELLGIGGVTSDVDRTSSTPAQILLHRRAP